MGPERRSSAPPLEAAAELAADRQRELLTALGQLARGDVHAAIADPLTLVGAALERVRLRALRAEQDYLAAEAALRTQTAILAQAGVQLSESRDQEREAFESTLRSILRPVVPIWPGVLLAVVVGDLDAVQSMDLMVSIMPKIREKRARLLILVLSAADGLDAAAIAGICSTARAARLLGCRTTIAGVRVRLAREVAGAGLDMVGLATHATVESALQDHLGRPTERIVRA